MGIERARVVEVHAPTAPARRVATGYLVGERLVLTAGAGAGRDGPTDVRPAGTATWYPAKTVWTAASGAGTLLEVDEPLAAPAGMLWGEVTGARPVPVAAMGFPPAPAPTRQFRDADQFLGHVVARTDGTLQVDAAPGSRLSTDGLLGAALFAGAELVGVLLDGARAVPVSAFAADPWFAAWAGAGGRIALTPVRSTPGFSIL